MSASTMTTAAATTPPPSNATIRSTLLQQLSHAQQTMDYASIGQTSLQILRFYIKNSHYPQAKAFIEHTTFPQATQVDGATFSYYTYYVALVKAIFLEYDSALTSLQIIVRNGTEEITPFHIHVYRLYIIVSLLTGAIPDAAIFNIPLVKANLQQTYTSLTQAVRRGDVTLYREIINNDDNIQQFEDDNTYTLILRFEPTIVRAGLRRVISVYSAISLKRIGELLHLPADDVHSIVSKAIADGVITATIDSQDIVHSISNEPQYASNKPQDELIQRINTAIELRQQCQQALRFPDRQTNTNTIDKNDKNGKMAGMDML